MKKSFYSHLVLSSVVCLLPIGMSVYMYNDLPEKIATHWNMDGVADGYSVKAVAAFAIPLVMLALNLIMHFVMNTDPKGEGVSFPLAVMVRWIAPALSIVIQPIILLNAVGAGIKVNVVIPLLLGALITSMGALLPKCGRNYTVGIKLPWTLNSDENWRKTHRFAGRLWIAGGALMMILSILNSIPSTYIIFAVVIVIAVIPMAYSYILYKKGV